MTNLYISNGTCYLDAGKKSNDIFGPCGNDAAGHKACCQLGDQCLNHNACYNGQFGTTYLAGCSDPEYKDAACPDKVGLEDTPWTGLVYCNGTSNEWVSCAQKKKPNTLTKPDPCYCPKDEDERKIAFKAGDQLDFVAQMPSEHGGSMVFQPGYVPTQAVTVITTVESGRPTSLTSTIPAGTETNPSPGETGGTTAPSSSDGSLSNAAIVGIAVGSSVGGLILLATIIFLWFAHRREAKKRRNQAAAAAAADDETQRSPPPPPPIIPGGISEMDTASAKPSELPDTEAKYNGGRPLPSPMTPSSLLSGNPPYSPSAVSDPGTRTSRPWSMQSELYGPDGRGGGDTDAERRERMLATLVELPG